MNQKASAAAPAASVATAAGNSCGTPPVRPGHPQDSSRVFVGLMNLARRAEAAAGTDKQRDVAAPEILRSLLATQQFRDPNTAGHARRVAKLCSGMAQHLGCGGRELRVVEAAALLHDLGKIGIPDAILFKPGALSAREAELMSLHHHVGMDVLQACRVDAEVLEIVSQAHLHYDSTRGSQRRDGRSLHLGARILGVADAYDAMRTDQVYRKGKSHEESLKVLSTFAGTQFDANVVSALGHWSRGPEGQAVLAATSRHRDLKAAPDEPAADAAPDAEALCHIFSYLYQLESLCDGFYLLDAELRFVVWSAGIARLLGHRASDMLHQVWPGMLIRSDAAPRAAELGPDCALQRVLKTGQTASTIQTMQAADGRVLDLETQTVPLFDERGRLHGAAEIFRDLKHVRDRQLAAGESLRSPTLDPLTQVLHRGELDSELAQLAARAKRNLVPPFSIVFMDLDHFKQINDVLGHVVGDKVLVEVARLLRCELYSGEAIGRYGGEEFLIICPETPADLAFAKAERIRTALTRLRIEELQANHLTASFGVAEWHPTDDVETLTKRADDALYRAKREGRNRTRTLRIQRGKAVTDSQYQMPIADPWRFSGKFIACMTANLAVFKLRSYVDDHKGSIVSVEPKRAVIRLGHRSFWSRWQPPETTMPIEITFEFGDEAPHNAPVHAHRRNHAQIAVTIRPAGTEKSSEPFQVRARKAFQEICSYFAGEVQESS
jgi:diguanylate cyclase (GGDEF)-like protein/putative nucleotidyltransferase with HDIG domain